MGTGEVAVEEGARLAEAAEEEAEGAVEGNSDRCKPANSRPRLRPGIGRTLRAC